MDTAQQIQNVVLAALRIGQTIETMIEVLERQEEMLRIAMPYLTASAESGKAP